MEPKNCRCVTDGILLSHGCTPRHPECCCNGTGKVWPSVEGEVVFTVGINAAELAHLMGRLAYMNGMIRVVCQPLKEGE